jgi:hypothetical protein
VLDGAALHLALNPGSAPSAARPLLRVGYLAMRRIADSIGVPVAEDPTPDDPLILTRQDFDDAVRWLRDSGWTMERSADDAWPHFRGWRVNYETAAHRIAYRLDLPPALWSGPRRAGRPSARPPWRPHDRKPGSATHGARQRPPGAPRPDPGLRSGGSRGVVPPGSAPGGSRGVVPPGSAQPG